MELCHLNPNVAIYTGDFFHNCIQKQKSRACMQVPTRVHTRTHSDGLQL